MKRTKLYLSFLLAVLVLVCVTGIQASAATDFTDYTPISSVEDLNNIRNDLSGKYYLTKDIVFPDSSRSNWTPVGTSSNPFKGILDGNGKKISGINVNVTSSATIHAGLFGYLSGTVRNLTLDGRIYAYCNDYSGSTLACFTGAFAGYTSNGTIENCTNNCYVYAGMKYAVNAYAGGIAGYTLTSKDTISDCINNGEVTGSSKVGGIAGVNNGTITGCSNYGSLSCIGSNTQQIGGITAWNHHKISKSFNAATISDSDAYIGGIAYLLSYGDITNCYNIGDLSSSKSAGIYYTCEGYSKTSNSIHRCYNLGSCTYGIAGTRKYSSTTVCTFTYCYHLNNVGVTIGGESSVDWAFTSEELSSADFLKYNFSNDGTWSIDTSSFYPYPVLTDNPMNLSLENISVKTNPTKTLYRSGDELDLTGGTIELTLDNGLIFSTPMTNDMISGYNRNATGSQTLTVTYRNKKTTFNVMVIGFAGGDGSASNPYQIANFTQLEFIEYGMNDCYKLIADIDITDPAFDGIGTKSGGYTKFTGVFDGNGHIISNLTIQPVATSSTYYGLFAYNSGTIKNLGLTNVNIECQINTTSISGAIGGIAGYSEGPINNCFVTGSITSNNIKIKSGGIVGSSVSSVLYCFSDAKVALGGGICGNGKSITNCYSLGECYYGISANDADIAGCYYLNVSTQGEATSNDQATACTPAQMKTAASYSGFDFTNTWVMSTNKHYPYPTLRKVPFNIVAKSIEIENVPSSVLYNIATKKVTFMNDESFKAKVVLVATNGARFTSELKPEMVTAPASTAYGTQKLTATYEGKSTTFNTTSYPVASGNGTSSSPYIIKDKHQLQALRVTDSYFKLAANITFTASDPAWTPVRIFSGELDGSGYTIQGLRIEHTPSYNVAYLGLIGVCYGTVKNLGIADCTINAENYNWVYAGGIAGRLSSGKISQCYFTGSITVKGNSTARIGGIAGESLYKASSISDCFNLGTLNGYGMTYCWLGGIVSNNEGTVTRCYNAGKLTSKNPRGIVGYDVYSDISNNYYLNNGALTSSKCTELSHESMQRADRLVGFDFNNTWCFRNTNGFPYPELKKVPLKINVSSISINTKPDGAVYSEKTGTAKLSTGTLNVTYVNSMSVVANASKATLSGVTGKVGNQNVTLTLGGKSIKVTLPVYTVADGDGSSSKPFCISKTSHLNAVRACPSACYKLITNLTFSTADFSKGGAFYNGGKLWSPIGASEENAFTGTFDGNNKSITGLKINYNNNSNTTVYLGLFGHVTGTVKNLTLRNIDYTVNGYSSYVGGITGCLTSGTISNCHVVSGSISALSNEYRQAVTPGGIVGCNQGGKIYSCHNAAYIEGAPITQYVTSQAGGIVGFMENGSVTACYNIGTVSSILMVNGGYGAAYGGGIVGVLSGGTVSDCYNNGDIMASYGCGGIAGTASSPTRINNCYNLKKIDRGYYGAIVGVNYGSMSNCYFLNETDRAVGQGSGYATSCTAAAMKKQATFKGFDFSKLWTMSGSKSYPYPEFRSNPMMTTASITAQPKSACVANGKAVKATISATGDGLTYQWYLKRPYDSKYSATTNKTKTYTLTMSKSLSGSKVYCIVKDKYGNSIKSNTVTFSNLAITTQPVGKAAANNKAVSITVKATGSELKYTWYIKDTADKSFKKASATSATYKCTMSKAANGRKVYCEIKDKYGNTVKSNTVTLSNLAVTTQPTNKAAANKKAVSVTVKASGSGLKYTWYIKDVKDKAFKKTSVTSATYKCTMSKTVNGRKAYCEIKDKYGYTVKTKTVTLSNLTITTQPASKSVANGKAVTVSVKATGTGLTYRWYIKDTTDKAFKKTSVTTASYKCTMSKKVNGRKAYCEIKDKYGYTVKTKTVTLSNLAITAQPANKSVANGKAVTVTVKATGTGLTYRWYIKDTTDKAFKKTSVTTASYKCTMSNKVNGRKAYCVIKDKFGNTVQTKTITLRKS